MLLKRGVEPVRLVTVSVPTVLVTALAVLFVASSAMAAGVFRVNAASAAGTPDGLSWGGAFQEIQDGVDAASRAGGGEVWVAQGTYTNPTSNRMAVSLAENVHVYGGFAGTETARHQRDWAENVTVIDGENASQGATGADNSTLDGFTITRGYSGFSGGGMYNAGTTPVVANCVFVNNNAYSDGGGMANNGASPTVINCLFLENEALNGYGGAIGNYLASPVFSGCVFSGNTAKYNGGAVNNATGTTQFTNCLFTSNTAVQGGAVYNGNSTTLLMNCTLSGNQVSAGGSAVYSNAPGLSLTNCIAWGDAVGEIGGSAATVTYSCVQGGHAGAGNISTDPQFAAGPPNKALQAGSPCIDTGTALGAPGTDCLGLSRPFGAGYDMGAYEYGATAPPNAPNVTGPASPTSDTTPTWTWTSGGNGGVGQYRYGYVEGVWLAEGVPGTTFTPGAALPETVTTLYVQERNAANHWSASGFYSVEVNTTLPTVTVPDVVGLDLESAQDTVTFAELTYSVVETSSDSFPAGVVMVQDPVAGAIAGPGSNVVLTVSTGPAEAPTGCAGCQTAKGALTLDDLRKQFGDTFLAGLALVALVALKGRRP